MNKTFGSKFTAAIGGISLLFISLFSTLPLALDAQTTGDGSYQMFGVNLIGTLPMMNKNGQSTSSGDLQTLDGKMSLKIPLGTIIHNAAGRNQEFISATLIPNPVSLPAQQKCIIAYELGTPGATFNPTVGLTFHYTTADLSSTVAESSLYIAQWNGSSWVKLTSDVNTSFKTVSTTVSSFTQYALLGSSVPTTTTTAPSTTTAPVTTTGNQNTTTSFALSTSDSSNDGSGSASPMIFVIGGGAVLLLIVLIAISRKK